MSDQEVAEHLLAGTQVDEIRGAPKVFEVGAQAEAQRQAAGIHALLAIVESIDALIDRTERLSNMLETQLEEIGDKLAHLDRTLGG